jgi:hypothetical protein
MLLGAPGEAAGMGPSGVPEEDQHAAFYQHVGHRDQVPFPAVAGIEGILDLLSFARGLVQHEFLGVVSSVALFSHENLPFRNLIEIRSISSLPNAGQALSCSVSYSLYCREDVFSETRIQLCESLCVRTGAKRHFAPL